MTKNTGESNSASKEQGSGGAAPTSTGKAAKPKDKALAKAQKYAVNPGPLFNLDDLLAIDLPKSRAEFAEVTAAMKAGAAKPDPAFTALARSNKLLQQAYLDVKDGVECKYKPNFDMIERQVTRKLTINSEKKTFGKKVFKIPPACVADQE